MKKSILFAIAVLVMVFFIACSGNPDSMTGEVRIRISDTSRGISPDVSMKASEYHVRVKDSDGITQYETTISKTSDGCSFRLPAGTYSISVDAMNEDGIRIGSGKLDNAVVKAGKTNAFSISVFELEGEGSFAVRIKANDGYGLSLKVYDSANTQVYSGALTYYAESGCYVDDGQILLENGFYRFEVYKVDSEDPIKIDTIRIVKDNTTTYSAKFAFSSTGSITIEDEILSTPTIVISLDKTEYSASDTVHASATVSGAGDAYNVRWYVDEAGVGSYGSYADLDYALNGAEIGTHSVSLFIKTDSLVWSESVSFSVLDIAPSVLSLNAADLGSGSITVSDDTAITLSNMDPDKVYGVRVVEQDGTSSTRGLSSAGVFKGSDNTFIPIPDETNCADFDGDALGIRGNGKIRIVELFSGEGPMVLSEANDPISYYSNDGARVYEKFFNIKFNKDPYRSLDKSRVALLTYGLGSGSGISTNWGYVTNGAGGLNPEGFTAGLYDFSHLNHINVYIYNSIHDSDGRISTEMIIMNPVVCSEGVETDLVNKIGVYSFVPADDSVAYVMEIHKNQDYDYSDDFNLRLIDGAFSGFTLPVYSDDEKDVHYIGNLSSELLVDISLYSHDGSGFDGDLGSVSFRPATQDEIDTFNEHVVPVNYDKTVITKVLEPGSGDYVLHLVPNGDFVPNNSVFTIEYRYDDGTYAFENMRTYLRSGHTYGVGYSGYSLMGAYGQRDIRNSDYLVEVSLNPGKVKQAVTATITIERSSEVLKSDYNSNLFVVPNNGDDIELVTGSNGDSFEVPELSWEGHSFEGLYCEGSLYAPGTTITLDYPCMAAVGYWTIDSIDGFEQLVYDESLHAYISTEDGSSYSSDQIAELLSDYEFQSVNEYSDGDIGYGKLTYVAGSGALISGRVLLLECGTNHDQGPLSLYSVYDESHSRYMEFDIEKVVLHDSSKRVFGHLELGNSGTSYDDVELRQVTKHDWKLVEGTTRCRDCGELRQCISFSVSGVVTMNADVDGLIVVVPSLDFSAMVGKTISVFPVLPEDTQVFVLSPSSSCNLSCSIDGQTVTISSTMDR